VVEHARPAQIKLTAETNQKNPQQNIGKKNIAKGRKRITKIIQIKRRKKRKKRNIHQNPITRIQ